MDRTEQLLLVVQRNSEIWVADAATNVDMHPTKDSIPGGPTHIFLLWLGVTNPICCVVPLTTTGVDRTDVALVDISGVSSRSSC